MSASTPVVIAKALAAAVRAPSPFNTQPWRFEVQGQVIGMRLDRDRVLAVADPDAREARLSCGAALCNLRVELRAQDRVGLVDLLPDRANPDLLAVVRVAGDRSATVTERQLASAIAKRHTNRHPFLDKPVPTPARTALASAARAEGARLVFIDASARYDLLVELIGRAERVQDGDGAYQHEMKRWLGGPITRTDGVPIDAMGPPPLAGQLVTMRSMYRRNPLPPRLFEQQPLLIAVLTPAAGPRYDLIAGAGMQRALLTACASGLSTSFLSQPFEVPATRAELGEAFRAEGEVHTLLRAGYGMAAGTTPRRDVSEVTIQP
ncbi:MAG: hypothetical protein GEU86_01550 [Actinophytocola sp.]|nr:hypothetical protein [Actinophytocola sp.]